MKIGTLYLRSFRSYKKAKIPFHPHLTFFYGPNASGKTNILEAISLLSLGKSFRGAQDKDMTQRDSFYYHISCEYKKSGTDHKLSYGCKLNRDQVERKIKLNEKFLPGRRALIGQIVSVIFSPTDISIAEGSPLHRRRFLDTTLSYQNRNYFQSLILFNQALRQRNAVLKKIRNTNQTDKTLEAWDSNLLKYASEITKLRLKFIQDFASTFQESLTKISNERDELKMSLLLSHPEEAGNYSKVLRENYNRDVSFGYTSIGPHRQDIAFEENGQSVNHCFSQGQKRSLVLALRMAQFYYLRLSLQLDPILLIDDVIGELDSIRRKAFISLLQECGQAIITTPNLNEIDSQLQDLTDHIYAYQIPFTGTMPVLREGNY